MMPSWGTFSQSASELSQFGHTRLTRSVAYLATVRADGSPRVHPVTPIISDDNLFVFMEPTSPKGKDLLRDRRYTLHCGVESNDGGGGEFYVRGTATLIEDDTIRQEAIEASNYNPKERYILFRLDINFAFMNTYDDGSPNVRRWKADNV
ncbi:MAG: pyridoxamine 5'-phosphate oxidase family protein [Chloroflexota bacterium]